MLKVRRTMTEVLLEVTNSEIDSVVEETLRKALDKGRTKSSSLPRKNILSSEGGSSELFLPPCLINFKNIKSSSFVSRLSGPLLNAGIPI
jgi:hypothetical protein